jgi:predicted metal-dependent HD superfamily phosphohydrolase
MENEQQKFLHLLRLMLGNTAAFVRLQPLFEQLVVMHTEPQRHYHTLQHINHLLQLCIQHQDQLQDKALVSWAICFHDCVYDPKSSHNEEDSAVFATKSLEAIGATASLVAGVEKFILATKKHENPENNADLQWFLDFDLSILGALPPMYDLYAQQIRKEYSHVPTWKYSIGRRKVLQHFLTKPQLFAFLPPTATENARQNMQRELKYWRWRFW